MQAEAKDTFISQQKQSITVSMLRIVIFPLHGELEWRFENQHVHIVHTLLKEDFIRDPALEEIFERIKIKQATASSV